MDQKFVCKLSKCIVGGPLALGVCEGKLVVATAASDHRGDIHLLQYCTQEQEYAPAGVFKCIKFKNIYAYNFCRILC